MTSAVVPLGRKAREEPELSFQVESASAAEFSAVPTVSFLVACKASPGIPIRSLVLNTQIRIDVLRRGYDERARERLSELFGRPELWARSARSLFWTQSVTTVPAFHEETRIDLPVAATYDFEVAVVKYFEALEDGEIPLTFLFSGTIFYQDPEGALRTALIPWDRESRFRLPVSVWREALDRHFPNTVWVRLSREAFDRLCRFKARRGFVAMEEVLDSLLETASVEERQ